MEVEVIKAKETIGNRSGDKRFERLRVAAYCRVSKMMKTRLRVMTLWYNIIQI